MINLRQRDKNFKHSRQSLAPYKKDEIDGEENGPEVKNSIDKASLAKEQELSGAEFLLSIAGMFESGETDISENVERYVAEALRKKYS